MVDGWMDGGYLGTEGWIYESPQDNVMTTLKAFVWKHSGQLHKNKRDNYMATLVMMTCNTRETNR